MARLSMDFLARPSIRTTLLLLVGLLCSSPRAFAQISPGPLSHPHADLEGISNCTKCHESGEEISGAKCLDCHVEIKNQIGSGHGFHFANRSTTCVTCHKEHLGKDARITKFDETSFDHTKTGFVLQGSHQPLKCEACHDVRNIRNADVKKVIASTPHKTFQGLDPQCVSCHVDRHKGTVSNQCQSCHGTKSWSPPATFDHTKTKFALGGKHRQVECAKCHASLAAKSTTLPILFGTKSFEDCTPCHASPHGRKFADKTCTSCHTAAGWTIVASFDHSATRFPLVGKHATVSCEKCHTQMGVTGNKTVSFATRSFNDCTPCHNTPHNAKFNGRECRTCHTPSAWGTLVSGRFDHTLTNYVLEGSHLQVECERCHQPSLGAQYSRRFLLSHQRCTDCHSDYHNGQFRAKFANECAECHIVKGFTPSTFSIQKHQSSLFALTGAHVATPCEECHKKEGRRPQAFHFASLRCESCHEDFHKGQFKQQMTEHSCAECHSTTTWKMSSFDHSKTRFALVGRHLKVKCEACHKEQVVHGIRSVQYQGLPMECESCHKDVHFNQFADRGRTRCASCHSPAEWHALLFNHETQSPFHLTGAHKNVPCGGCHKEEKSESITFVRFKPLESKCESCHQMTK